MRQLKNQLQFAGNVTILLLTGTLILTYVEINRISPNLPKPQTFSVLRTASVNDTAISKLANLARSKFRRSLVNGMKHNCRYASYLMNIAYSNSTINVSMEVLPMEVLEKKYSYLSLGGHYTPKHCKALYKVAVIVPYRDRASHLRILLNNIHPFLTDQLLDYSIIVVEQAPNQTFNRGKLINVGFVEAMKLRKWDCVVLHDVDLIPEDKRNLHFCPIKNPRHMSAAIDKFEYRLSYDNLFGGSAMLSVSQFQKINGFSNRYWGWGGEDDDLFKRIDVAGYHLERYDISVARYKMIKHEGEETSNPVNPCRYNLLSITKRDWNVDGLNSLHYKLLNITLTPLYTHLLVDLLASEEKAQIDRQFCLEDTTISQTSQYLYSSYFIFGKKLLE